MTTGDDGSVTFWIEGVKGGDAAAAEQLWRRYFQSLVRLAQAALRASPRGGGREGCCPKSKAS